MTQYTFHPKATKPGGSQITINVDKDGEPFGQLWTFKKKPGYYHPWHAKALNGEHACFYSKEGGLDAAKKYITGGKA